MTLKKWNKWDIYTTSDVILENSHHYSTQRLNRSLNFLKTFKIQPRTSKQLLYSQHRPLQWQKKQILYPYHANTP